MRARARLALRFTAVLMSILAVGFANVSGIGPTSVHNVAVPVSAGVRGPLTPLPGSGSVGGRTMAVGNLTVGDAPFAIAYDSGKGEIFVGNVGDASFSTINDRTNTVGNGGFGVGSPFNMIYDSGKGEVFSVNSVSGLLNVINDTNDTVSTSVFGLGNNPFAGAYDPAKGLLFVANEGDIYAGTTGNTVSVVSDSTNTVIANVSVGDSPNGVAYDPAQGELFVSNGGSDNVSVINDTNLSVVATISLSSGPSGIVYDGGQGEIFVAYSGLGVISPKTNTVIKTLKSVSAGYGLAYDSRKGEILSLTEYQLTGVSDSNYSFLGNVSLGKSGSLGTQSLAYDARNGFTYVTLAFNSGGAGKVALVSGAAYPITVKESGLPSGTTWYVNRTGGTLPGYGWSASAGTSIPIWLVNGTFQYGVAANKAYASNPSFWTVVESGGSPSSQSVTFAPAYKVTFQQKGLPTYYGYWVNVSGQPVTSSYFFSTITELLPNATYNYSAGTPTLTFDAPSGNFTVKGSAFTLDVNFTAVTYPLWFNETGLGSGDEWYVNTTYAPYGYSVPSASGAAGSPIVLNLINGTYTFSIETNHTGLKANLAVDTFAESAGVIASQSVFFGAPYNVTFNETGLPTGTTWSVYLIGQSTLSGTSTNLTESIPNGTYNYSFYSWNPVYYSPPGQITIAGISSSIPAPFGFETYLHTVQSRGLPSSDKWYLNETNGPSGYPDQNGSAAGGTGIALALINGTYTYSLQSNDHDYTSSPTVTIYVYGTYPSEVSVSFSPYTYGIAFDESGLPSGTQWRVWVNSSDGGQNYSQSSTRSTLVVLAVNGSYAYRIADEPGWHLNSTLGSSYTGVVTVAGASPAVQSVIFDRTTYGFNLSATGLPPTAVWYVNLTSGPVGFSLLHESASAAETIVLALANGTYSYHVATNDKDYAAAAPGNLTESSGIPTGTTITFVLLTNRVAFQESGLPSGATWYVNFTSGGPAGFSLPDALGASGTPCVVNLPNGSYDYSIQSNDKTYQSPGGSLSVVGAPISKPITFNRVTYSVTSQESGLPSGTEWWLNITGGTSRPSTIGQIVELLPNGSYSFTITSSDKRFQAAGGSFSVDGASVSLAVSFTPVTYAVSFGESGLPPGTLWSVSLGGTLQSATSPASVVFSETNGSGLTYRIGSVSQYSSSSLGGTLNVSGSPVAVTVTFTPSTSAPSVSLFTISPVSVVKGSSVTLTVAVTGGASPFTFEYSGLPAGCVSVNSSTLTCTPTETGTRIVEVTVTDSVGREAFGNASLTVAAAGSTGPGGPTVLGLPAVEGYAVIVGILAIITVMIGVLILRRRRRPPELHSDEPIEEPPESP